MRHLFALAFVLTFSPANSERVILVPMGNKVLFGTARLSSLFDGFGIGQGFLEVGVTRDFEIELSYERFGKTEENASFGFSYNFLNPLTDFAPGMSIGVLDALDNTMDRRQVYISVTYRYGQEDRHNQNSPFELTVGAAYGRALKPLIAASLPLTRQFRGLVEHDGLRITAGVEFRPIRNAQVRWIFRERQTLYGLNYSVRF